MKVKWTSARLIKQREYQSWLAHLVLGATDKELAHTVSCMAVYNPKLFQI